MAVTVRVPTSLRKLTGDAELLELESGSVIDIINDMEAKHPGIKAKVCDDSGELRRFVNIYVDGEDIRFLSGKNTVVENGKEMSIVPSIAGG